MKRILIGLMMFMLATAGSAAGYTEGKEYTRVTDQPTETGDKIEVLEFFWYGCPHCYAFDPYLDDWKKSKPANVEFLRVPAVFRPAWKVHARTYYSLQLMGYGEKFHTAIFDEIHKNKKRIDTLESIASFLENKGVDRGVFEQNYHSFAVDNFVRKANKKVKDYGVTGVPTMAVNGKYVITGRTAGSMDGILKVMNYLIAKEEAGE